MQTINDSSVSSVTLQPLINFVSSQYKIHNQVILHVVDCQESGRMTNGWTGREDADAPIIVKIKLSSSLQYPRLTRHVKETPIINLSSFDEEFVLVLAHELRHASQFDTGAFRVMTLESSEVDAENYAIRILERYRAYNNKLDKAA